MNTAKPLELLNLLEAGLFTEVRSLLIDFLKLKIDFLILCDSEKDNSYKRPQLAHRASEIASEKTDKYSNRI